MVGHCTDIHVERGGNMAYTNCELFNSPCCWELSTD